MSRGIGLGIVLGAVVLALGPGAPARAAVIIGGQGEGTPGQWVSSSYDIGTPFVEVGSAVERIELQYEPPAGPLGKLFEVGGSDAYHHLHIVEHWRVAGRTITNWHQVLMVPDGEGGWVASGNYDDLWWSCRGGVTPEPVVIPEPSFTELLNVPDDSFSVWWDGGLVDGTEVTFDHWVTVPAGMESFAIFQFVMPEAVPEPAAMAVLGLGVAWLVRRRRRAP